MDSKTTIEKLKAYRRANIYIYGNGETAGRIRTFLEENGVTPDGSVVDDQYAESGCLTRTQLLTSEKPYVIIRGNVRSYYFTKEQTMAYWPGCVDEFSLPNLMFSALLDDFPEDYYDANENEFWRVRGCLSDELSRKTMDAYLEMKIYGEDAKTLCYLSEPQYFFENAPWKFTDSEVFVDCGAFNGDTIRAFCDAVGEKYRRIFAFEPDGKNCSELRENVTKWDLPRVEIVQKGTYSVSKELRFSAGRGSSSMIVDSGDIVIETETIDHVLHGEQASIIKMDIEGSEREALVGARETIQRWRPILMICAYHRRDDIFVLYDLICSMVSDYSFYLRQHSPTASELVLYAVPNERME